MKKRVYILIVLLALFMTGCSTRSDKTVIRFSTWGSASEMSILKPIITEFERENPEIKIELQHIPQDYFQKLHLLIASNLTPDVIFINNLHLLRYKNYLEDLSHYVNKSDYFDQSIKGMSVDNKLYAIPRDVSNVVVYYNKDLFRKNGVGYPDKNWNIEDLVNISKSLSKNGVWGIGFEPTIYYVLPFMHYFGGGIFSDSGEDISDSEGSKRGINLYKDLIYKYHSSPTPAQRGSLTSAQMFIDEKIAMHLSGRWLVPKYRQSVKFDWDIVNFPHSTALCDGSGWAVSKSSKHKDIAIKFVLFLSSTNNIEKISQDGLIVPANRTVANSDKFLAGKPHNSQLFIYAIQTSKPSNIFKNYIKISDKLADKIFQK